MNDTKNLISKVNDTPRTTPKKETIFNLFAFERNVSSKKQKTNDPKVIRHFFNFCDLGVT
jgi:hypothetical protein